MVLPEALQSGEEDQEPRWSGPWVRTGYPAVVYLLTKTHAVDVKLVSIIGWSLIAQLYHPDKKIYSSIYDQRQKISKNYKLW